MVDETPPEPWTVKLYALDRRPPADRNKLCRGKIDPDMKVPHADPLVVVEQLADVLRGMEPEERRECVRFEIQGPPAADHQDYYGLAGHAPEPEPESTPQESPGGEQEDPDKGDGST